MSKLMFSPLVLWKLSYIVIQEVNFTPVCLCGRGCWYTWTPVHMSVCWTGHVDSTEELKLPVYRVSKHHQINVYAFFQKTAVCLT